MLTTIDWTIMIVYHRGLASSGAGAEPQGKSASGQE
jgi:hypothetical protein